MAILGLSCCGDQHCGMATPTAAGGIHSITLQNCAADELYVTTNVYTSWDGSIPEDWDFGTRIHALFHESLLGGNVEFTSDTISTILVKKRKEGELTWKTMFEIPIHSNHDFNFIRQDFYNRSGFEYSYCLVPTLNGIEANYNSNYNTSSITAKYKGIFLIEKDLAYHSIMKTALSTTRNYSSSVITARGRSKPYVFYNGDMNYKEFDVETTFVAHDQSNCLYDFENSWKFREAVDRFLTDKKPKILKNQDGEMALVCIVDPVSHADRGHPLYVSTSFSAVETGDCESISDLYHNGLIDCGRDVTDSV